MRPALVLLAAGCVLDTGDPPDADRSGPAADPAGEAEAESPPGDGPAGSGVGEGEGEGGGEGPTECGQLQRALEGRCITLDRCVRASDNLDGRGHADSEHVGDIPRRLVRLSQDGRYITFLSDGADLAPRDDNGTWDAFLYDRETAELTRLSEDDTGGVGDAPILSVAISGDGSTVAMVTTRPLVPGDRNEDPVVYVRHLR